MLNKSVTKNEEGKVVSETLSTSAPHSIEVSRSTKGIMSWTIKMYFGDEGEFEALSRINEIHDKLVAKYKAQLGEVI